MQNATRLHPRPPARIRGRRVIRSLELERAAWVATLAPDSLFYPLFDHLPGVFFFAKDRAGRTMFASRGILGLYQMTDAQEMLGLTDFDINPKSMAESYVRDDEQLLSGRVRHLERVELWFDRQGMPDWFMVTKLPLLDLRGRPQGVMGVLRRASDREMQLPLMQAVAQAVQILRREYPQRVLIAEVARTCGQSLRQLQRHFRDTFGLSPQEFLIKTRILASMRLLEETSLSAAEIAHRCGFLDGSSFCQHFRKRVGHSPGAYRKGANRVLRVAR